MARFETDFSELDSLIDDLDRLGDAIYGETADRALQKGGQHLTEYFRGAISERNLIDTGQLLDSIGPTKVEIDSDGKHLDVYPQGKRHKGGRLKAIRNADVGFIHEYGAPGKSIPATHWMSNTVDDVQEEVLDVMQDVILETIDKYLGGK